MASRRSRSAVSQAIEAAPVGWSWADAPRAEPVFRSGGSIRLAAKLAALVIVAVLAFLGAGFLGFVASIARVEAPPAARADGIVALTGGADRIGNAIDLLAQGYGRRLLISGVNERTSRAEIARLNPGQRRLFDCCVDLDYRARNTIGNAIETRRWLYENGFRSVIVVTSTYHMPRTLLELDNALPGLRKVPFPVVTDGGDPSAWWRNPGIARLLATEYVKYLAARLRILVESDPEVSPVANLMSRGGGPVRMVAQPLER
ncbi:MAG TPA: YdcF family protein [Salinarimonas sp.]|nr:YdcF family protein [Salinarimonas sp.]